MIKVDNMKKNLKFILLGIVFILIWAFNILVISPKVDVIFAEPYNLIIRTFLKLIIWVGYSLFFINKYNKDLKIRKEELFKFKEKKLTLKLVLLIITISFFIMLFTRKGIYINGFTIDDFFNKFLLVGIEEELVFRGLILNGLSKKDKFAKASIITSILFALIHIPLYIRSELLLSDIILNCLKIVVISCFYNGIFNETKSIWPIVIFHSFWDISFFLFR